MNSHHHTYQPSRDYSSPEMLDIVTQAPVLALMRNPHYMQQSQQLRMLEEEKQILHHDKRQLELQKQGLEMNVASLITQCQTFR
jgi:hypothetical protein